jgi:hypothetical protein
MAKAHTIDDVINSVINNYQTLLVNAVVHVAEQAKKDIKDKAVNVLYKYYYGDYEPTSYDRIYALQHAIVPFSQISTQGQKIECVVGVEYSPAALEAYLDTLSGSPYDASQKYGRADADWVIQNFWEGKHPYTDGSSNPGAKIDYYYSSMKQDDMMRKNDDTGYGLLYYAHTIFPHAVMNHMLVNGAKIF